MTSIPVPRIAGICPSMVDVSCRLSDRQFEQCGTMLGLEPGNWTRIDTSEILEAALAEIDIPCRSMEELQRAELRGRCAITAGSSILGMMGVIHPSLRQQAFLASAIPQNEKGVDPFFNYFHQSVLKLNAAHHGQDIVGANPVGLILTTMDDSEKMLATYQGVSSEFDAQPLIEELSPEYILVDSYEMQHGTLKDAIDRLLDLKKFKIALSLGNKAILAEDGLRGRIRSHIDAGNIHILAGNREEFGTLYPELPHEIHTPHGFRDHPLHDTVPFSLLTDGPNGLTGHAEGVLASVPAHPVNEEYIINTSGAGDTAMGAFCDGVIRGHELPVALSRASYLASQVLLVSSSRLERHA